MDLQAIIKTRFDKYKIAYPETLSDLAAAEEYIKQSYESRYIFELIQNARDAAVRAKNSKYAIIKFILNDKFLSVTNSGEPFNERGINDICSIGKSQKESKDFIGHKGLGFKAVKEISDKIKIITRYGTLSFDKEKTLKILSHIRDKDSIPLFSFPHFEDESLNEDNSSFVTCVNMYLRADVSSKLVSENFKEIHPDQLVLLGNIKEIEFKSNDYNNIVDIKKNGKDIIVTFADKDYNYTDLSPKKPLKLPISLINKLDKSEQAIFKNDPYVEFKIIFRKNGLSGHPSLISSEQSNFYLFYPLEISSGFRFLIHSYFTVTPDRKSFRKSPLNKYLLNKIASYIGNDLLDLLKKHHPTQVTECLYFERGIKWKDDVLTFINDVKLNLENKEFIYCNHTNNHYKPINVILCDNREWFDIFDTGVFLDKHIVFIENRNLRNWLFTEFSVKTLSPILLKDSIDSICKEKSANSDIQFFERFYQYFSDKLEYSEILKESKILYTSTRKLVNSKKTVFLRGAKSSFSFPPRIEDKIYFLYPDIISTESFRNWKNKLGISPYSTRDLSYRLINLFTDEPTDENRTDIMNSLMLLCFSKVHIENEDDTGFATKDSILYTISKNRKNILVPYKYLGNNEKGWINPLYNAVYFPRPILIELYPNGKFLDVSVLDQSYKENFDIFFENIGVWSIPAIFILKRIQLLSSDDTRKKIPQVEDYSYVYNDRLLDVPEKIDYQFTDLIVTNFSLYIYFLQTKLAEIDAEKLKSQGYHGNCGIYDIPLDICFEASQFGEFLKSNPWICTTKSTIPLPALQVQGITKREREIPQYKFLENVFNLFSIDNYDPVYFPKINLCHFSAKSVNNFIILLSWFHSEYKEKQITIEIERAYNFLLSALTESLYTKLDEELTELSSLNYLCFDEFKSKYYWKIPSDITFIDKRPLFNKLDIRIKSELQPQFTSTGKTGFGKMAKRIGAKPMNIDFSIVYQNISVIKECDITAYFSDLSYIIALLEYKYLNNKIDSKKELESIKETKVCILREFKLNVCINNSDSFSIPSSFFTEKIRQSNRVILYILSSRSDDKTEIILDYLSTILERDIEGFRYVIKAYNNKDETLINDNEITDRSDEITALLSSYKKYELFWIGILVSKGIKFDDVKDSICFDDMIDFIKLSELLRIEQDELCNFNESYDFNSSNNIEELNALFDKMGISLSDYNKASTLYISFKVFHNTQIELLIFKTKNKLKSFFYNLCITNESFQELFYTFKMDNLSDFNCPNDVFHLDINNLVEKYYQAKFPYKFVRLSEIENFTEIDYESNYENITKQLKIIANNGETSDFFDDINIKSLSYFPNNLALLKRRLEDWIIKHNAENPQEALHSEASFWDQVLKNKTIENDQTTSVDNPHLQNASGSSGSVAGDGESSARKKNRIGAMSERLVFELLTRDQNFKNVKWISKNAERAKVIQHGDDFLGYDIIYDDITVSKQFEVEVKTARIISGNTKTFEISYPEINHAINNSNYKIILVTFPTDPINARIFDIGNIFFNAQIKRSEKNIGFTLEYKNYIIHIKT